MISDIMHDANVNLERYLTEETFRGCYHDVEPMVRKVMLVMDALRTVLDAVPGQGHESELQAALTELNITDIERCLRDLRSFCDAHRKSMNN